MYHQFSKIAGISCLSTVIATSLLAATQAAANTEIEITQTQYLSDILNTIDNVSDSKNSIVWLSQAEIEAQKQAKDTLLEKLTGISNEHNDWAVNWLITWLDTLPVTGRVATPISDSKLMEIHPNLNPLLTTGDLVKILQVQDNVTVIASNGMVCKLPFVAGSTAKAYTDVCGLDANSAYVIAANGKVKIHDFSAQKNKNSSKITAGSTLWLNTNDFKMSDELSKAVAEFIATQASDYSIPQPIYKTDINNTQQTQKQQLVNDSKENFNKKYSNIDADLSPSYSDWGLTGLIQTPTARLQKAGNVALTVAKTHPYSLYTTSLQPTDNLEIGFRFVDIADRPYGKADDDGNKSLKDKSLSVKLKLIDEKKWLPSVAVGMRDPLGTGLFDGEYVVANKRFNNLDMSLGLGFGYLGRRNSLENPLASIDENYKERQSERVSFGGAANYKNWFTGKATPFAGVLWQSPYKPLSVKVEYDGNDYSKEPSAQGKFVVDSPLNLGLQWQKEDINVNLAYQRGNQVSAGITLHDNVATLVAAPKPPKYLEYLDFTNKSYNLTKKDIADNVHNADDSQLVYALKQSGINVIKIVKNVDNWRILVNQDTGIYLRKNLENNMPLLHNTAPTDIKDFYIDFYSRDEPLKTVSINRDAWLLNNNSYVAPSLKKAYMQEQPAKGSAADDKNAFSRGINYHIKPSFSQSFGGPDGFLYALDLDLGVTAPLWQNAWLDSSSKINIHNNYDEFDYLTPSELPRVRTDIQKYATTSNIKLSQAQFTQLYKMTPNWFMLSYAGYLEPMYAGIGNEIMYRPYNSKWAVGLDFNNVQKRDYDQGLGLQDYRVNTGHLNLYLDSDWHGLFVNAKIGKYLAGDVGATLDLAKKFANGAKIGAWATKTNISAKQYGEGRFDKGIYFSVPLDALVDNVSNKDMRIVWHPLLRDGGAALNRRHTLWNLTKSYDPKTLKYKTKEAE